MAIHSLEFAKQRLLHPMRLTFVGERWFDFSNSTRKRIQTVPSVHPNCRVGKHCMIACTLEFHSAIAPYGHVDRVHKVGTFSTKDDLVSQ